MPADSDRILIRHTELGTLRELVPCERPVFTPAWLNGFALRAQVDARTKSDPKKPDA